jgi:mono/diheme cytochrome c family protein
MARYNAMSRVSVCVIVSIVLGGCQTSTPVSVTSAENTTQQEVQPTKEAAHYVAMMSGAKLYDLHCSACHGIDGNGMGQAARYLHPKPRDFRAGGFRLVSSSSRLPTLDDIASVIRRGMPGTSMRSFEELDAETRRRLAEQVMIRWRDGVREKIVRVMEEEEEEEASEQLIQQLVDLRTTATDPVVVPTIGEADSQSIARGKAIYFKQSCHTCHGDDGVGTWDTRLVDNKRRATRPRDLVHEPYKGGHEPNSIYRRILLGMPGTPHPSSENFSEEQLIDLVQFCSSLSQEPKPASTNYERATQTTSREYLTALGRSKTP